MRKVYVTIHLHSTEDGGRRGPIPLIPFRCLLLFKNIDELSHYPYDCRIFFNEGKRGICPGETMENVPVAFLSPDKIFPYISIGTKFNIRDGKIVGDGIITAIDKS